MGGRKRGRGVGGKRVGRKGRMVSSFHAGLHSEVWDREPLTWLVRLTLGATSSVTEVEPRLGGLREQCPYKKK